MKRFPESKTILLAANNTQNENGRLLVEPAVLICTYMERFDQSGVKFLLEPQSAKALSVEAEPVEPIAIKPIPVKSFSVKSLTVISFFVESIIVITVINDAVKKTHIPAPFKKLSHSESSEWPSGLQRQYVTRIDGATG